ncbi:hypothetical protein CRG98_002558 [Punica granatum]|uniref:Reverse transcriptase domain-containing protein n=1 Tax=Punica granatum TaxID=22663 RepID=A0A2I0L8M9_PUNGR|nr:hypothetical protein CRG98_002558 [Punica granatum]
MAEIKEEAVKFYKQLLGADFTSEASLDQIESLIQRKVPADLADMLVSRITDEEIKTALFSMGDNKAPGPDGYSALFFKFCWSIIKDDFVAAIKSYFSTGKMRMEANSTIIILVPEKPKADHMKDFRPISCCNIFYQCFTKVLPNRLKKAFPILISKNQSAFIKGRRIADNILVAHELVNNYHRSGITARCAVKVDLMKAFDSISWDFILVALSAMGMPSMFINWIKGCITTPYFSVALHGTSAGYFPGARGVRQGDPLSPYLFVVGMEVLCQLLDSAIRSRRLGFHPRCKPVRLTHLFIFTNGSRESLLVGLDTLDIFHRWSGLRLNPEISELYCGGLTEEDIQQLLTVIRFKKGHLPVKYPRLPLVSGKLSLKNCEELIEKIVKRIKRWTVKHLSYAGRLRLINSVIFISGVTIGSLWGPLADFSTRGLDCFPMIKEHDCVSRVYRQNCWRWPRSCDSQAEEVKGLALKAEFDDIDKVIYLELLLLAGLPFFIGLLRRLEY